jgi:hypothetical protein
MTVYTPNVAVYKPIHQERRPQKRVKKRVMKLRESRFSKARRNSDSFTGWCLAILDLDCQGCQDSVRKTTRSVTKTYYLHHTPNSYAISIFLFLEWSYRSIY